MPGAVRAKKDLFGLGGQVCVGSCDVQVNSLPAVRVGDIVVPHLPGGRHKIPVPVITGACQVLVNGRKMVRIGDTAGCQDPAVSGSCDVQVGTQTAAVAQEPNLVPGTVKIDGRTVYENTSTGIEALVRSETSVSPSLVGYHEESQGQAPVNQSDPQPVAVPAGGCKNSRYFKLADSRMAITAQMGLSQAQIECNWIDLCTNILDRLVNDGFKFKINSGFRTTDYNIRVGGSNNSDHSIGCAVDISSGNTEANRVMFKHMLNNYPYSQLIFEGDWIHIAYNGRGPKGAARVMYTYSGANPQIAGANGQNLPSDLRA